jgi:hypothetical protein
MVPSVVMAMKNKHLAAIGLHAERQTLHKDTEGLLEKYTNNFV